MSSGFILTRGKGVGSTSTTTFGVKSGDVVVPPGETRDVDATAFTSYVAAKWLITVVDSSATKLSSFEAHGYYLSSKPTPSHNISSLIGDKIHTTTSLAVVASSLVLRITNNESYSITVRSARYDIAV